MGVLRLCLEPENLKSVARGASGSKTETLPPVTFDKDGKQLGRWVLVFPMADGAGCFGVCTLGAT